MRRAYNVRARSDSEGGVWVAESEDVRGLVAEAESPNVLARKLGVLIPELLELNGALEGGGRPRRSCLGGLAPRASGARNQDYFD